MRSNFQILSRAWDALGSQWLLAIGLCVLHGIVNLVLGSVGFGLGSLVAGGALTFGFNRAMVLIYRGHVPRVETYFDGFKQFLPTFFAFLLVGVIVFIGSMLLVIPGIIAGIGLSQTFYILQDNPEMGAEAALQESWRLTWKNGNMWKVFFMGFLSLFVMLGGLLAFGVGLFFAIPLISVMMAGLYEELRLNDNASGRVEFV